MLHQNLEGNLRAILMSQYQDDLLVHQGTIHRCRQAQPIDELVQLWHVLRPINWTKAYPMDDVLNRDFP